jgi:hypothetical protein
VLRYWSEAKGLAGLDKTGAGGHTTPSPARPDAALAPTSHVERLLEIPQFALLLAAWTVAFLLGKELQTGFNQWRDRDR